MIETIKLKILKLRWYFLHPKQFLKFLKRKYIKSNFLKPISSNVFISPFKIYIDRTDKWRTEKFVLISHEYFLEVIRTSDEKKFLLDSACFTILQLISMKSSLDDLTQESFIQYGLEKNDTLKIINRLTNTFII